MSLEGDKVSRGLRLKALRERREMTVLALAAELNTVAETLGVPAIWSGPRITKMEQGGQNYSIEDVAVLSLYEPSHSWVWWAYGVEQFPKRAVESIRRRAGNE